jgi:two-component system KDP operon response regulator KdpE
VLAADGLELDLTAHEVRRNGETVHLTPIEFELLHTMMRNRRRLMTHRALLTEVWGPAYASDTQTLRVHVANLRRKIEPDAGAPRYITTDAGVGYRFEG